VAHHGTAQHGVAFHAEPKTLAGPAGMKLALIPTAPSQLKATTSVALLEEPGESSGWEGLMWHIMARHGVAFHAEPKTLAGPAAMKLALIPTAPSQLKATTSVALLEEPGESSGWEGLVWHITARHGTAWISCRAQDPCRTSWDEAGPDSYSTFSDEVQHLSGSS